MTETPGESQPPVAARAPEPSDASEQESSFDFALHRQKAIEAYRPVHEMYGAFAAAVFAILRSCLDSRSLTVHSIQHRAKSVESFGDKAELPSDENPNRPKYERPLTEITDLAGVRVITYFLNTVESVDEIIGEQFEIVEKTDRSAVLREKERFGYQSVHYLGRLRSNRHGLPEYAPFVGLVAEIQVRTILQHAWAEIEHDIQYKVTTALPMEIRRRFMTLAGLLEVGDREFQGIQDDSERLKVEARASVAAGRFNSVEITPDSLKAYVDRKYGPDGRMRDWSYEWEARLLRRLGFADLRQLDHAIAPYDDALVSRTLHGTRQGQLTRLEDVLLAAMGDEFSRRHPWASEGSWFRKLHDRGLRTLTEAAIPIGSYRPEDDTVANTSGT